MTDVGALEDELRNLRARLEATELQLSEANETLEAIRQGDVDAIVVGAQGRPVVYTLEGADRPYRTLVEQMKEGAVTLRGDGLILYCNESFARLVDAPKEKIVGENLSDFVVERQRFMEMLAAPDNNMSADILLLVGGVGICRVNLSIVELEAGVGLEAGRDAPQVFCAIVTDLTQHFAKAAELGEAHAKLAAETGERARAQESLAIAMEAADMGGWEISLETGATRRSPRHDAIFGYHEPPIEWALDIAVAHFVPEDRDAVRKAFELAERTGRVEFDGRIHRANDGALRWVYVKGQMLSDDDGERRVVGVIVDNTERRQIEDQLRQAQKMEAVGQLTGGIAHDFNNLLMIIGGSLEAFARRVSLDQRTQALLTAAQNGVARGAKLNEQLLAFSRRQDMQVESTCVNDLIPGFEALLGRAVGESVQVRIEPAARLWHCMTDPHQLETAILNLAINGRDAMEASGSLCLSTENAVVPDEDAALGAVSPGDYVKITVSDTGGGMDETTRARAFEPFFTTKGVGKGTGLGLSQVYGFAKQSEGFVTIQSEVGVGTSVSIYLPRAAPPERTDAAVDDVARVKEAHGTILLVEDDADVRSASRAMLEELGYGVLEAPSGQAALNQLDGDESIDLVFTDVIMASGMTGIELARAIATQRPSMPVLLTSGYTAQRLIPTAMNGDLALLRKPYDLYELALAVRQTIEAKKRQGGGRAPP